MRYLHKISIAQSNVIENCSNSVCDGVGGKFWDKCYMSARREIEIKLIHIFTRKLKYK